MIISAAGCFGKHLLLLHLWKITLLGKVFLVSSYFLWRLKIYHSILSWPAVNLMKVNLRKSDLVLFPRMTKPADWTNTHFARGCWALRWACSLRLLQPTTVDARQDRSPIYWGHVSPLTTRADPGALSAATDQRQWWFLGDSRHSPMLTFPSWLEFCSTALSVGGWRKDGTRGPLAKGSAFRFWPGGRGPGGLCDDSKPGTGFQI